MGSQQGSRTGHSAAPKSVAGIRMPRCAGIAFHLLGSTCEPLEEGHLDDKVEPECILSRLGRGLVPAQGHPAHGKHSMTDSVSREVFRCCATDMEPRGRRGAY